MLANLLTGIFHHDKYAGEYRLALGWGVQLAIKRTFHLLDLATATTIVDGIPAGVYLLGIVAHAVSELATTNAGDRTTLNVTDGTAVVATAALTSKKLAKGGTLEMAANGLTALKFFAAKATPAVTATGGTNGDPVSGKMRVCIITAQVIAPTA